MNSYSNWNGVDLHIHSIYSNNVKGSNDFEGKEYTATELLDTLKSHGISIFSITDHNSINIKLYEELQSLIENEKYSSMSFLTGVELDVYDESICQDVFHCLCFIDSVDYEVVSKAIKEMFLNKEEHERNKKDFFPKVSTIIKKLAQFDLQDILLIPHFNNKSKGISSREAVKHLNYLCFNAYEDSNNISGITTSLNKYIEAGYTNFPFAVFSDCHNLNVYPKIKSTDISRNPAKCYMLSDISEPFNSIKTAFEEPSMRISIEGVSGMRSIENGGSYISEIINNDVTIKLSPYQNTIIGKFGSGKSLLMHKIRKGLKSLKGDEKYGEFHTSNDNFKIVVGGSRSDSLEEALATNRRLVHYDALQQESYYFTNKLTYDNVTDLFSRLNIPFDFEKNLPKLELKDTISEKLTEVLESFRKTGVANNFNYELAFSDEEYFTFILQEYRDFSYLKLINSFDNQCSDLDILVEKTLHNVPILNKDEKAKIRVIKEILKDKSELLRRISESKFEFKLFRCMEEYKLRYIDNNDKEAKDIFLIEFTDLNTKLIGAYKVIEKFENDFNVQVFNDLFKKRKMEINNTLEIEYSFNEGNDSFKSLSNKLFTTDNRRSSFFMSWVHAVYYEKQLIQRKSLEKVNEIISSYVNNYNELFTIENTRYDFIYNGESVLKRSPGEKASKFINIVFELIEEDLKNQKNVILTFDQPEDNIDNDNTYNLIALKIKELKFRYNNLQIIVVTHNANVGISADSENLIIATDNRHLGLESFEYTTGSIENRNHIENVCNVLEGGRTALRNRSIKYGINIIRKVERNGV